MEYLIIQVDDDRVTAARFMVSGRSMTIDGAVSFALGDEQGLAGAASRIAGEISGSPRIVLCLSAALFAQRPVELPLTDLRKVREVLPAHMQNEIALPADEAVFDALPAPEGKFLALWAKRADIAHFIDIFREAGIEPQIVSAAPFAWPFLPGAANDGAVSDGSALAVIREGMISFVCAISGEDPAKQMASTITALELSGMTPPQMLFVLGRQAGAIAAAEGLPLPVERLELPDALAPLFKTDETFMELAGLYAVALACQAGALPDFRRGGLAWTAGDARFRKKLRLTAILGSLAILLLFAFKGMQYRAARGDLASLNISIAGIYHEIFPTRAKAVDEVAEIKGEIRKLAGVEGTGGFLDVLKRLAEAKGASINGLYEAELEGNALRIKGDARSAQAVNEFKTAVAPLMATVELGEVKSRPDGTVTFSLTGMLKEVKK